MAATPPERATASALNEVVEPPYVLVATVARDDATTTLFFGHVSHRVPMRIVESAPRSLRRPFHAFKSELALAPQLAGAAALIVNRGLFEVANVANSAHAAAIPCYYFIDDNFIVLRDEGNADALHAGGYTITNVRRALAKFEGVLCATESLQSYFLANRLHHRVELYPPVSLPAPRPRRHAVDRLRVAFFGGAHRRDPFVRIVLPAIERLSQDRRVTLYAAGIDLPRTGSPGLEIVPVPYDRSYSAAILEMARHEIDVLVHPTSATDNNVFKNPHVLINARALGAVPVFSHAPPYDALAGQDVCVLSADSESAWFEALSQLDDASIRAALLARIDDYCERHFSGDVNASYLSSLIDGAPDQTPARSVRAMQWRLARGFVADLSRRLVKAA